ncbi:hypothetical protein Sbs19_37680 [Sphingobium sp. BS19]|nr:hypothetical protein Sbs19_37680 [Sphingobium sp. BS19]
MACWRCQSPTAEELERENAKCKWLLADTMLVNAAPKNLLTKNFLRPPLWRKLWLTSRPATR